MGWNPLIDFGAGPATYGRKPKVPDEIHYGDTLKEMLATNKEILPSLTELGLMSTDAINQNIERLLPGAMNLRDSITQSYQDMIEGKLPKSVQDNIRNNVAAANLGRGTSGSFETGDLARSLGLTSYELSNRALTAGSTWFGNLSSRAFDPSKSMLGPSDAIRQAEFNWNRDYLQAQVRASPDPTQRGQQDTAMGAFGIMAGAYGGAAPQQRYQSSVPTTLMTGAGGGEQGAMGGSSSSFGQQAWNEGIGTQVTYGSGYPSWAAPAGASAVGSNAFDFGAGSSSAWAGFA